MMCDIVPLVVNEGDKMKFEVTAYSDFHGRRITLKITAANPAEAREFAIAGGAKGRIDVKESV